MDFEDIENLNEQQILDLYKNIIEEEPIYLSTEYCPVEYGTGTYYTAYTSSGRAYTKEICK